MKRLAIDDLRTLPYEHLRRNSNPVVNLNRPNYADS